MYLDIIIFEQTSVLKEMKSSNPPLTNVQVELLKVFSRNLSDADLLELKKALADFFAKKAMDEADAIWQKNNWTKEDEENFSNDHLRTPYEPK